MEVNKVNLFNFSYEGSQVPEPISDMLFKVECRRDWLEMRLEQAAQSRLSVYSVIASSFPPYFEAERQSSVKERCLQKRIEIITTFCGLARSKSHTELLSRIPSIIAFCENTRYLGELRYEVKSSVGKSRRSSRVRATQSPRETRADYQLAKATTDEVAFLLQCLRPCLELKAPEHAPQLQPPVSASIVQKYSALQADLAEFNTPWDKGS